MSRCRVVTVDGEPVRVQGARAMTPADEAALAEVVRAARAALAAMPPGPLARPCSTCGSPAGEFCQRDGRRRAVCPARREGLG